MRLFLVKDKIFSVTLVLTFLLVGIIGIIHHEMWRDELQAWLIARDSSSLLDLIRNLKYEGHPGLWHTMLYIITRFSKNPVTMQYLHLIIATVSVFLVARFSPFTRLQKIFLVFGYFNFYEYLAISRNYSIAVLLIFLVCSLYPRREQKSLAIFIILGLLANTNFYAWMISVSFAIVFTLEFIFRKKDEFQIIIRKSTNFFLGLSFYLVAAIASFVLMLPTSDRGGGMGLIKHLSLLRLARTISTIWKSYIPIPQRNVHFWNTNFFMDSSIGSNYLRQVTMMVLVFIMLIFVAIKLSQLSKNALRIYVLGTLLIFTFNYVVFIGSQRHHGNFFILLIACIWIALAEPEFSDRTNKKSLKKKLRIANPIFTFFLFIHFFSSIWPYYIDLSYPFTMNQATAQYLTKYIKSDSQDNLMIAGYRNAPTSAFSALLDTPIYYPQNEDYGSFIIWNKKNLREMTDLEIIDNIVQESREVKKKCILVLTHEFDSNLLKSYQNNSKVKISQLMSFTGSIVPSEIFYVYEILLDNNLLGKYKGAISY